MTDSINASCSRKHVSSSLKALSDPPLLNAEEEEVDRQYIQKIVTAFRYYAKFSYARLNKTERYFNSLPKKHQKMLANYKNHLGILRDCIKQNQKVISNMLLSENFLELGGRNNSDLSSPQDLDGQFVKIPHQDMDNAQSTLKLIARDWSAEGEEERNQSYKLIIDTIAEFYNPDLMELNEFKILVPGAGLGRLTYDLACRGYECEGNEYSYFMLIASYFILNQCNEQNKYTLYPWIHQYVNNLKMEDQVASIRFPDICPVKNPPKGKISISAGDFLDVYKIPNSYDCVASCFFIDCANNIVDFIETIYRIIVPGGIWINLGPLLYHYSDIAGENSIEPTYENLVAVIEMVGFEILRNETGIRTKYAQNPKSMLKTEYESFFWVCRKPSNANDNIQYEEEFSNFENCDIDDDRMDSSFRHSSTHVNGYNK